MTEQQITAIKCALADLQGSLQAFQQSDMYAHDWEAHQQSIDDLLNEFDFLAQIA